MIDLTPLDVRKKKGDFRRALRGYDPLHVDDFLDIAADRLERLVRENLALQERVAHFESQMADNREREKALTEALVTAQEMREEVRAQSAKEAQEARREAESDAVRIRAEAQQVRAREEELLRRLRGRQLEFLQTYRTFLERELAELGSVVRGLEMNGAMGDALATPPRLPASTDLGTAAAAVVEAAAGAAMQRPSTDEWATPAPPPSELAVASASEPELILSDDDVLADADADAAATGATPESEALPEPEELAELDEIVDAGVRAPLDAGPHDATPVEGEAPGVPSAQASSSKRRNAGDDTGDLLRSLFGDDD